MGEQGKFARSIGASTSFLVGNEKAKRSDPIN
jgi:hypothetical protein